LNLYRKTYLKNMSEERDVLDLLHEILETDRAFYNIVRFLDSATRNHVIAANMRNTNAALGLLRTYMAIPAVTNVVMNIPLDASSNFFDPVPVVPTPAQIDAAVERHVGVPSETTCSICQETVNCATRIRHCGHCFHEACIREWFSQNPRCPMCRHDIRNLQPSRRVVNTDEGLRVHADEE
jgi:hypothetical protein